MKPVSKLGKVVVGLLCLILVAFMTVEIAHGHADAAAASHCQLCSAAHVATDVQPPVLSAGVLVPLGWVYPVQAAAGARPVLVTALIRPPPPSTPFQS